MPKIFKITYNNGGWYSGGLPYFLYIAENEDEIANHSKKYQEYLELQRRCGGHIGIREVSGFEANSNFENIDQFDLTVSIRRKCW